MTECAPINKILPYSVVDGPGNRVAIFVQGCNLSCAYCHNPETQRICSNCGDCVSVCPAGALRLSGTRVVWNKDACIRCDRCISRCPHHASPKVTCMTAKQVMDKVRESVPFIRGITTSGGECALYPGFLRELYCLAHREGLTCLMDSNGAVDLSRYPSLMAVCDGVMLDVKSWEGAVYSRLTGGDVTTTKKNLTFLASSGKLTEIRIVTLPGEVDAEACIEGIAALLGPEMTARQTLKVIRFRPFGVRGRLETARQPGLPVMERLKALAQSRGFTDIRIL